jgi:rod shape-determining protein MreC
MRVIWWLLTVVAVCTISIVLSERHALDPVQNISLTITSPLEGGLRDIAKPVNDLFDGVIDRGDLVRENQELKETIAQLETQIAEQQDAQQRVLELEAALGVKQSRPDDQLLAANVIAEEPSGLKRAIAIDRGLSDGIDEGMVVLSRSGVLVGTVSRAYQDFAWIRLITDPDSAVNAQVNLTAQQPQSAASAAAGTATPAASPTLTPPSVVRGVAEGDLRQGIVLDLLPSDSEIAEGTLVLTSGLGGNYPRGLLLGSVRTLEARPQSPFTRATVEPAAELSGLDTVLVLISFRPARLSEP